MSSTFFQRGQNFSRGDSPPLVTGLVLCKIICLQVSIYILLSALHFYVFVGLPSVSLL